MEKNVMIPSNYYDEARRFLSERGYTIIDCPSNATPTERAKRMKECDAIIARTEQYTEEMIDGAESLKVIARAGVGFDKVPVDYCTAKGIWVTFTPQANYIPVAEHSFGMMMRKDHGRS